MSDSVENVQEIKGSENAIDAEALENIASQAAGEDAEPQAAADSEILIPTEEILLPIVSLVTALTLPNWKIKEEENKVLSQAYGAILDKYFPDVGGSFGVEVNALIVTGAIFAPRLGKPRILEEKKEDESGGGNSGGGQSVAGMGSETLNGETVH